MSKFTPEKSAHQLHSKVTIGRRTLMHLLVAAYNEGKEGTDIRVFSEAITHGLENRRTENMRIIDDDSLIDLVSLLSHH